MINFLDCKPVVVYSKTVMKLKAVFGLLFRCDLHMSTGFWGKLLDSVDLLISFSPIKHISTLTISLLTS